MKLKQIQFIDFTEKKKLKNLKRYIIVSFIALALYGSSWTKGPQPTFCVQVQWVNL